MPEPFNASVYLVDRQLEAAAGDRVAIRCGSQQVTYQSLLGRVCDAASGLAALGVRPEERVMLVMADGVELVAAFLGAMRLGAVPVPMNTMLTAADLVRLAENCRARVALTGEPFTSKVVEVAEAAPELEHLVVVGESMPEVSGAAVHSWREVMEDDGGWRAPYRTWDESPGFWLYTSGTTGRQRGAIHRHVDLRVTAETYAETVLGIQAGDRCFSVAKLFFAYGLGNSLTFPLAAGACTVLDPGLPSPGSLLETLRLHEPTLFFGVPTFYAALLAADLPDDSFKSVRHGVSAGEPLPAPLLRRFKDRFGVDILDGIGSTEALHIFISNRKNDIRPGSTGTPVDSYELRLLDDDGNILEGAATGHLELRGDSVAIGYWCDAASTRYSFRGDWLHTGDVYARSEDGYYTYLSRSDDLIKAGGIWVAPAEVESVLLEYPGVLEAAVVGLPDEEGLDKPAAFVVPLPGQELDVDAVVEFCKRRLAPFKRPRKVVLVDELPKTATGKIQRFKLRQLGGLAAPPPTGA